MTEARNRTLMLVDDEDSVLSALKRLFRRDGYRILTAPSGPQALQLLQDNEVDVIISDQRMPGMTGVDFLRQAKLMRPGTIRMTLSGFTDLQSIIDAVNEGAVFKFLTKPWDDERLRDHVAKAFRHKEMADENRRLSNDLSMANNNLAELNLQLESLLARQKQQAQLVQTSVGGLRDIVELLPAALVGIDPDGALVFMNQAATGLLPEAMAYLGREPEGELASLLQRLPTQPAGGTRPPVKMALGQGTALAWRQRLPASSARQGELLLLLPWLHEVTP